MSDPLNGEVPHVLQRILKLQAAQEAAKAEAEAAAAARAQAEPVPTVAARLEKKFGLGDDPARRRRLYQQLEKLVERYNDEARALISEAVMESATARAPARYFCRAIKLKLRDAGLTGGSSADW